MYDGTVASLCPQTVGDTVWRIILWAAHQVEAETKCQVHCAAVTLYITMQTESNRCELQSAIMLPGGQTVHVLIEVLTPLQTQVWHCVDP